MPDKYTRKIALSLIGAILAASPGLAQAIPLNGYPIRVEVNYEQRPLVCPSGGLGTFGWTKKLQAAGRSLPEGAAGAVLWQEGPPPVSVVLYWMHPIYNPVNDNYTIPLNAVSSRKPSPGVRIVATYPYPASRGAPPMSTSGAPAAGVNGMTTQAGNALTFNTRDSRAATSFWRDTVGYGVDIWAIREGVGGCSKKLATYTFFKPAGPGGGAGSGGGPTGKSGGVGGSVPTPQNRIQVIEATYGGNVGARRGNVTSAIAQACNGRATCTYTIDYRVIGDPVPGRGKDYRVSFRCLDGAVRSAFASPEAGFRKKVTLNCPMR